VLHVRILQLADPIRESRGVGAGVEDAAEELHLEVRVVDVVDRGAAGGGGGARLREVGRAALGAGGAGDEGDGGQGE
jgi:hypothetical protein